MNTNAGPLPPPVPGTRRQDTRRRQRQRGGIISLLLSVLVVGLLAWLLLRHPSKPGGGSDTAQAESCVSQNQKLVLATGGLGEAYRAGYARLPPECQRLLPPPGANDPSAVRVPEAQ